jgi:hypothetical protein
MENNHEWMRNQFLCRGLDETLQVTRTQFYIRCNDRLKEAGVHIHYAIKKAAPVKRRPNGVELG